MSFDRDFKRALDKEVNNLNRRIRAKYARAIGKKAVEIVRNRTRRGEGVSSTGRNKRRLEPLSLSYKVARRTTLLSKLSPHTTPDTSNLTLTGEMLESLAFTLKGNSVLVHATGQDNIQKAKWAEKGSSNRPKRRFLHLSKVEIDQLTQHLTDLINDSV